MARPARQLAENAELDRDPTQTITLRRQYTQALGRRWRELISLVRTAVVEQDALALERRPLATLQRVPDPAPPGIRAFDFATDPDKIEEFTKWLREAMDRGILEVSREAGDITASTDWYQVFVRRGYAKGIRDAERRLRAAGREVEAETLARTFNQPIHAEKLRILFQRNFRQLDGITAAVDQNISRVLADGLGQGLNPNTMATQLNREIRSIGLRRSRVLARTEIINAHAEATLDRYQRAGIDAVQGQAEFATAGDERVCPICQDLEGEVFTLEEARGVIPVHAQCFPPGTLVEASGVQGVSRRFYEGPLVTIRTDAGHQLTGTPNHPVLTDRGWMALGRLNEGSRVVRSGVAEARPVAQVQDQGVPARIEDVAEAFGRTPGMAAAEVPVAPVDFHGDGAGSQVAVVRADGLLRRRRYAACLKCLAELTLHRGLMESLSLASLRSPALGRERLRRTAGGFPGRTELGAALLIRHLSPLQLLSLRPAPDGDASFLQALVDGGPGNAESVCQAIDGLAGDVSLHDLIRGQVQPLASGRAQFNTGLFQTPMDGGGAERILLRKIVRGQAGSITFDQVRRIDHRDYSGQVYNLQTRSGRYVAGGLVVHNCRCSWLPVTEFSQAQPKGPAQNRSVGPRVRILRARKKHLPDWYLAAA